DGHDTFVEQIGGAETLGIPWGDFTEHAAAVGFAKDLHHALEVPAHHAHALVKSRIRQQHSRFQVMPRLGKDPRVVKRAAPNAHTRTTGLLNHHLRGFRCCDVAIADNGNAAHRLRHRTNAGEIHRATKTLFARAAMDKYGGNA